MSRRAKEAIKTALAMVIAYGIALAMDWDRPYWAGFAVAFVSLATYGQSLNKAALRMAGTGVGVVVAFLLIMFFPQQRWLFIIFLSLWVGFCAYLMGGEQRQYFWQVSGFVAAVVALDSGPDPVNAFATAVLRAQETGMGILVYSLVACLLWPSRSGAACEAAARELLAAQSDLYEGCRGRGLRTATAADTWKLSVALRQAQQKFDGLLAAAQTDTFEIWEARAQWQQFQARTRALSRSLYRWRDSLDGLQDIDLNKIFTSLQSADSLLGKRFKGLLAAMDAPGAVPAQSAVDLAVDADRAGVLSAFQKAELTAARLRWRQVEANTRSLLETILALRSDTTQLPQDVAPALRIPRALDPDRLLASMRVMLILWVAYLAWIYVPDLPGGIGIVSISAPLGLILVSTPQLRVFQLFKPAMISTLCAGLIYMLLMPKLTTFFELGLMLFAFTFFICYQFAAPAQMLGRAFGLAMFLNVASISNDQVYSFMVVANTALLLPFVFLCLAISTVLPVRQLPERRFRQLLMRYFRSSEYLLGSLGSEVGMPVSFYTRRLRREPF